MKAPCKDCPDREVGCHGKCESYAQFKAERNKEIETIISNRKDSCRARPANRRKGSLRKREGLR